MYTYMHTNKHTHTHKQGGQGRRKHGDAASLAPNNKINKKGGHGRRKHEGAASLAPNHSGPRGALDNTLRHSQVCLKIK